MKHYRLVLAPIVLEQIREQVLYIASDSIDHALAWEDRLRTAIQSIADVPGFAVDEEASSRLGEEVRKYVFEGNYLVHFKVDDASGSVAILNFRHAARLPLHGEP